MIKPKKLIIYTFCVLFATFAGAYLAVGFILNSKTILQPILLCPEMGRNDNYEQAKIPGFKPSEIYISAVDGNKMHAWLFKKSGSNKIAIVSHGNAANLANRVSIAKALLDAGCSVLLYDYRGYGKSTGTATMDGIMDDGISVYDFVHNNLKYSDKQIVVYGESIGSGVTCHIASLRPCLGVILQSGVSSIPSTAKAKFPLIEIFPDFVLAQPHLANAETLSKLRMPLLIIHGKKDYIVPPRESEKMFARANEPKTMIWLEHCGHNDIGIDYPELHNEFGIYNNAIQNFVTSLP